MWHRFFRLIAVLLLWVACAMPAFAQDQALPEKDKDEPNVANAPAYAAAIVSTLVVLVIVCKPSRKA